ncbi:MAG: response regulator transcription factor [Anaerolineae bacterium]|nr:response regulator transcription factor [Anaerolineae bacterium]
MADPIPALAEGALQRILVVDDDPALRRLLRDKLDASGYEVWTAASGGDALELIGRRGLPHLAIVDINMPGMNGLRFCETVLQFCDLPIIMLSAIDEEEMIVGSISRYAEDYVTKPFSPRELTARAQRVLRRISDYGYASGALIEIDSHLAIDIPHQRAVVAGQPVALTPTETKLLYLLMRNAGHTVSTEFLLRRLWPMEEVFEDSLRVHVHRLRQKIEPAPSRPRYILTERGVGYSFPAKR